MGKRYLHRHRLFPVDDLVDGDSTAKKPAFTDKLPLAEVADPTIGGASRGDAGAWRLSELARDSFRNLGFPQFFLLITLTAALVWASWGAASAANRAIAQEVHVQSSGANVWIAQAGQQGPLPATPCINLAYNEGVVSAGGIYSGAVEDLADFPGGRPLPVALVTPGWAAVYVPGIDPGVTVGSSLVDEYRIEPGGALFDTSGQAAATVDIVVPADAPTTLLASGVTIPARLSTGLAECAIRMVNGNGEYGRDLLSAAIGGNATARAGRRRRGGACGDVDAVVPPQQPVDLPCF